MDAEDQKYPYVGYVHPRALFRVVRLGPKPEESVIELSHSRDAMGQPQWRTATVSGGLDAESKRLVFLMAEALCTLSPAYEAALKRTERLEESMAVAAEVCRRTHTPKDPRH